MIKKCKCSVSNTKNKNLMKIIINKCLKIGRLKTAKKKGNHKFKMIMLFIKSTNDEILKSKIKKRNMYLN